MSSTKNPRRLGNYEVGYGRPPVATRFKLGNRCNPRGRPKRKKTVGELIEEAMNTKVKIAVDGRPTVMTKQKVIIHNLVNAAARGDHKAIQTLFSLEARYRDSTATVINPIELEASDRKIIEQFLASGSLGPATPEPARDDPASPAADGDERGSPDKPTDSGTSAS